MANPDAIIHEGATPCRNAASGADGCTAGTIPAAEMERVVIDEIRALTGDETLLAQVLAEANTAIDAERAEAERHRDDLRRQCKRYQRQLQQLSADGNGCDVESGGGDSGGESAATRATAHPGDLHEHLATAAGQLAELEQRIAELKKRKISPGEARAAFADFDRLWERLIPREQARLLRLLISEVVYDGTTGSVSITFRPTSIRSLIDRKLEDAA